MPIFQQKGALLVEHWLKLADSKTPVLIREDITKATSVCFMINFTTITKRFLFQDVIGEAAFAYKINAQQNDSKESIYHIMTTLFEKPYTYFENIPYLISSII